MPPPPPNSGMDCLVYISIICYNLQPQESKKASKAGRQAGAGWYIYTLDNITRILQRLAGEQGVWYGGVGKVGKVGKGIGR